jgi:uncharacterized protein (TIGR02172 family)
VRNEFSEGTLTYFLSGMIDSKNAYQFEEELKDTAKLPRNASIAFDATELEYISSAGLRVLLNVQKQFENDIHIINVSDKVYDVFEVTGLNNVFDVERALRFVSLKGCKKISSALNGEIFRLSDDEMIKVYGDTVPLSEIKKERSYARTAMVCGVPTLIPYDVVRCEEGHGIVFEKAEMTSLAYLISRNPDYLTGYAELLADMVKELHSLEIPDGKLPDIKDRYMKWIDEVNEPNDADTAMFRTLISSIPDSVTYVHGDINLNSVMIQNGELLLLDMSGSARGNSLFDLSSLFASLVAIENKNEGYCLKTYGLSKASCLTFWNAFFTRYMSDRPQTVTSMNELLAKYFILKERILMKLEKKNSLKRSLDWSKG